VFSVEEFIVVELALVILELKDFSFFNKSIKSDEENQLLNRLLFDKLILVLYKNENCS
jgi:hypothetical protein